MDLLDYTYTDLQDASHEIRLLQIANPRLHLQTYSLDNTPPYLALSYTREPAEATGGNGVEIDPSHVKCIAIGNPATWLKIPTNLYEALLALVRRIDTRITPIYVWVDAICINQANNPELMTQLNILDRIYARANKLIAWLGPDEHNEMAALKTVLTEHLIGLRDRHERDTLTGVYEPDQDMAFRDAYEMAMYERAYYEPADRGMFHGPEFPPNTDPLESLFSRAWFGDAWVMLDVSMAGEIEVWCGDETFSWVKLECAYTHCKQPATSRDPTLSDRLRNADKLISGGNWNRSLLSIFLDYLKGYRLLTGQREDHTLAGDILEFLSDPGRTNLQAKTVNHKELIAQLPKSLKTVAIRLLPDSYRDNNLPVPVLAEHTKNTITRYNWLGALSFVKKPVPNSRVLPSWLNPNPLMESPRLLSVKGNPEFNATGRFQVSSNRPDTQTPSTQITFSDDHKLSFPAFRIATIKSKSELLSGFFLHHTTAFEAGIDILLNHPGQGTYHPTHREPTIDAFWKTLIAGGGAQTMAPEKESYLRKSFNYYWLLHHAHLAIKECRSRKIPINEFVNEIPNMERLRERNPKLMGHEHMITVWEGNENNPDIWALMADSGVRKGARGFERLARGWVEGRVLFGTEGGHIGLGFEEVEVGDEVWVTPFGGVPLVLRPLWEESERGGEEGGGAKEGDGGEKVDGKERGSGEEEDGIKWEDYIEWDSDAKEDGGGEVDNAKDGDGAVKWSGVEREDDSEMEDDAREEIVAEDEDGTNVEDIAEEEADAKKEEWNCFWLVGECYVHGVMHGELFSGDKEPEWENIWLE